MNVLSELNPHLQRLNPHASQKISADYLTAISHDQSDVADDSKPFPEDGLAMLVATKNVMAPYPILNIVSEVLNSKHQASSPNKKLVYGLGLLTCSAALSFTIKAQALEFPSGNAAATGRLLTDVKSQDSKRLIANRAAAIANTDYVPMNERLHQSYPALWIIAQQASTTVTKYPLYNQYEDKCKLAAVSVASCFLPLED